MTITDTITAAASAVADAIAPEPEPSKYWHCALGHELCIRSGICEVLTAHGPLHARGRYAQPTDEELQQDHELAELEAQVARVQLEQARHELEQAESVHREAERLSKATAEAFAAEPSDERALRRMVDEQRSANAFVRVGITRAKVRELERTLAQHELDALIVEAQQSERSFAAPNEELARMAVRLHELQAERRRRGAEHDALYRRAEQAALALGVTLDRARVRPTFEVPIDGPRGIAIFRACKAAGFEGGVPVGLLSAWAEAPMGGQG